MRGNTSWSWLGAAVILVVAAAAAVLLLTSNPAEDRALPRPDDLATAQPSPAPAGEVRVYFSRGDTTASVARAVSGEPGPEAALRALLAGPNPAEQAAGISSWFSPETANLLNSFTIDADSVAHVDFGDLPAVIPSASSSAGSELLLRELNSTLFHFPEIARIEYTVNGSCEAFWNWLQYDCELVTRPSGRR